MINSKVMPGKHIAFAPSPSEDVVGYRMYYCSESDELTDESAFIDVGNRTELDIPGEFDQLSQLDGLYKLAMVAYDEEGNFSESGPELVIPLDFVPPEPPGAIVITSLD